MFRFSLFALFYYMILLVGLRCYGFQSHYYYHVSEAYLINIYIYESWYGPLWVF
jgi:hypothetical protein